MGIDPGIAITGYGIIEAEHSRYRLVDYGCIRTAPRIPLQQRLLKLHQGISMLIDQFSPDYMAVEQLFFNRNTTTAIPVGQARGVILLAAAEHQLALAEYTPLQVKQAIVGYGRAEKTQIQFMVMRLLKMKNIPKPDDAADALAIAISHAHFYSTRQLHDNQGREQEN